MEKTFTLIDINLYLKELSFLEKDPGNFSLSKGPGKRTIQNLIRYSSALNILKTSSAGNIYQLMN